MTLWQCSSCTTLYAPGAPRCPFDGSTEYVEFGGDGTIFEAPGDEFDPQTITYAATITPDARAGVDFRVTATGDLTLAPPSSPVDGQDITIVILASGGVRTLTVDSAIKLTTSVTPTVPIGSGKRWFGTLSYITIGAVSAWYLLGSAVQG